MNGLYLYCIRERTESAPAISNKGIDGNGKVFALAYRDIEAVVSHVSLEEFASEEIQHKAQEDVNWIKDKALIHESIIEEAMKKTGGGMLNLMPMRFGIVFREKAKLEETLGRDYIKIKAVFDRIRGKQDWNVKGYLKDKASFERAIKENNETIRAKEKEIASLPEGMAFFMEEELNELISREFEKAITHMTEIAFERIKKLSVASIRNKAMGKELTGRRDPMVLNAACLIPDDGVEEFKKEIGNINLELRAKGLELEYSGPWPAFDFSEY